MSIIGSLQQSLSTSNTLLKVVGSAAVLGGTIVIAHQIFQNKAEPKNKSKPLDNVTPQQIPPTPLPRPTPYQTPQGPRNELNQPSDGEQTPPTEPGSPYVSPRPSANSSAHNSGNEEEVQPPVNQQQQQSSSSHSSAHNSDNEEDVPPVNQQQQSSSANSSAHSSDNEEDVPPVNQQQQQSSSASSSAHNSDIEEDVPPPVNQQQQQSSSSHSSAHSSDNEEEVQPVNQQQQQSSSSHSSANDSGNEEEVPPVNQQQDDIDIDALDAMLRDLDGLPNKQNSTDSSSSSSSDFNAEKEGKEEELPLPNFDDLSSLETSFGMSTSSNARGDNGSSVHQSSPARDPDDMVIKLQAEKERIAAKNRSSQLTTSNVSPRLINAAGRRQDKKSLSKAQSKEWNAASPEQKQAAIAAAQKQKQVPMEASPEQKQTAMEGALSSSEPRLNTTELQTRPLHKGRRAPSKAHTDKQ